jgi:hypothetical protein
MSVENNFKSQENYSEYSCEYCKKVFSSISNLNYHKRTANFCIKIQNQIKNDKKNSIFICEYCDKEISSKTNLSLHMKTCKVKECTLKKIDEYNLQKEELIKHYESKLLIQKDEYEKKIISIGSELGAKEIMLKEEIMDLKRYNDRSELELKIRKEEIKELKNMLKEYMKNDSKRVDKKCDVTPVINKYQTINNIHTHIKPLDTSQERFDNLVTQFYDYPMYKKGVRGMVELLITFFTYAGTEEENIGKLQAYCSDINRGYIKTFDPDFSEKLHTLDSLFDMCKNSSSLKNKKVDYYNQMLDDLKAELKDDLLACEQSLIHSTDSFSKEKFKESYNRIKEKFYNFYKTIISINQEN